MEEALVEGDDIYGICHKVLGINFAAIHTSTTVRPVMSVSRLAFSPLFSPL